MRRRSDEGEEEVRAACNGKDNRRDTWPNRTEPFEEARGPQGPARASRTAQLSIILSVEARARGGRRTPLARKNAPLARKTDPN